MSQISDYKEIDDHKRKSNIGVNNILLFSK